MLDLSTFCDPSNDRTAHFALMQAVMASSGRLLDRSPREGEAHKVVAGAVEQMRCKSEDYSRSEYDEVWHSGTEAAACVANFHSHTCTATSGLPPRASDADCKLEEKADAIATANGEHRKSYPDRVAVDIRQGGQLGMHEPVDYLMACANPAVPYPGAQGRSVVAYTPGLVVAPETDIRTWAAEHGHGTAFIGNAVAVGNGVASKVPAGFTPRRR